jgi:hypothetical protein
MRPFTLILVFVGIASVALGSLIFVGSTIEAESQTEESISEFRSDGVEVVHQKDGSKDFKITIEDSVGSSDDLR